MSREYFLVQPIFPKSHSCEGFYLRLDFGWRNTETWQKEQLNVYFFIYIMEDPLIFQVEEFEWDKHNTEKIEKKHKLHYVEIEEVFFDEKLKSLPDIEHSKVEERYMALGRTRMGKLLFVAFTIRKERIRVISARFMSRKERRWFYEEIKEDS